MPKGLDELNKNEKLAQEWEDRVFDFLEGKKGTSTPAYTEDEIVSVMSSTHSIEETDIRKYVRHALFELFRKGKVDIENDNGVIYHWVK